ncbi:hypothetical protein LCGC14_1963710 [marine sediment metagenome]|uniref:C2H2-type domain-containing protein n=1 Tax=marine sediment metagenome TaxID=412755 RepID=A0A0F9IAU6_9ZZZZ
MEIKKRKKIGFQYFVNCPVCNEEITGISEKHVKSNMSSHLNKHTGDKK